MKPVSSLVLVLVYIPGLGADPTLSRDKPQAVLQL